MQISTLVAWAAAVAASQASYIGFNYGSTFTDGSAKQQSDFKDEFTRAKNLVGTKGEFTSARLYTMIQGGTADTPISAIPAAIDTQTTLLLGLWASAGQADFTNEVTALTSAIKQYGTAFTSLIAGISVGSEDLYRISPTGIENDSGAGANPADLVNYINQVRAAIRGTSASGAPIGHVDTWTAWVNGTNDAVIDAVDWLGMDAYPYFENTIVNHIDRANLTFFEAYDNTVGAAQGKAVWVTETGWPVSGPMENQAVASIANAATYWQEVGCTLFGQINTWWYVLQDAQPTTPNPSFGIIGSDLSSAPLYRVTCNNGKTGAVASASSSMSLESAVSAEQVTKPAPSVTLDPCRGEPGAGTSSGSASMCQASAAAATPASGSAGHTNTIISTTLKTITSCTGDCSDSMMTFSPSAGAATVVTSAPVTSSTCTSDGCPNGSCSPIWTTFQSGASGVTALNSQPASPSAASQSAARVASSTCTSDGCPNGSCSPTWTTFQSGASGAAMMSSQPASPSVVSQSAASNSVAASAPPPSAAPPSPATSSANTPATASGTSCPADLNGPYEFPHLIVPVNSAQPDKAYGTQYNGTITPQESTIFNFDLPASYAGKTCSLVFLFPEQAALETSAYTFNGRGGITVNELSSPATQQTTYNTVPKAAVSGIGSIPSLQSGHSYVVASHECAAGARTSFEFVSTGGLSVEFFQDFNPSPLGAYIRVC